MFGDLSAPVNRVVAGALALAVTIEYARQEQSHGSGSGSPSLAQQNVEQRYEKALDYVSPGGDG